MIVLLTGAPGAGKGTQADLIAERLGYRKISTGDALRKHVKEGTEVGKKAGAVMNAGKLVSDDILFDLVKAEVGEQTAEKVLLDGYPRTLGQANDLKKLEDSHSVAAIVHLDVPRQELISRLSGRLVCRGCGATYHTTTSPTKEHGVCDACGGEVAARADDDSSKVAVRLDVYNESTKPVLDFYREAGLVKEIDGTGSTEEVFQVISGVLKNV